MLSKNQLKDIRKLAQKKFRDDYGLTRAEGLKVVKEIMEIDPNLVQHLIVTEEMASSFEGESPEVISNADMDQLSLMRTAPGVLAVVQMLKVSAVHDTSKWTLALDDIRDPGNMGTILRTAAWFGCDQVVCSANCVDVNNPKVINASMGAAYRLSLRSASIEECARDYTKVYGTVLDGEDIFSDVQLEPGLVVIGNESKGISDGVLDVVTDRITIPGGGTESLNASVAAGLIMGHIYRQQQR